MQYVTKFLVPSLLIWLRLPRRLCFNGSGCAKQKGPSEVETSTIVSKTNTVRYTHDYFLVWM